MPSVQSCGLWWFFSVSCEQELGWLKTLPLTQTHISQNQIRCWCFCIKDALTYPLHLYQTNLSFCHLFWMFNDYNASLHPLTNLAFPLNWVNLTTRLWHIQLQKNGLKMRYIIRNCEHIHKTSGTNCLLIYTVIIEPAQIGFLSHFCKN